MMSQLPEALVQPWKDKHGLDAAVDSTEPMETDEPLSVEQVSGTVEPSLDL
jgi:hypothetical protein